MANYIAKAQFKANTEFIYNRINDGYNFKYIYESLIKKNLISMKYNTFWIYCAELKKTIEHMPKSKPTGLGVSQLQGSPSAPVKAVPVVSSSAVAGSVDTPKIKINQPIDNEQWEKNIARNKEKMDKLWEGLEQSRKADEAWLSGIDPNAPEEKKSEYQKQKERVIG
jgi:hypothetical protein